MSRLTDCQLRSMISRMKSAVEMYAAMPGKSRQAERSRKRLEEYRAELADRAAGRSVPAPQRAWINGEAR